MPLKPFARPRQSMPASAGSSPAHDSAPSSVTFSPSSPAVPKSPSVRGARVSVGGALPGTPTPLHGKSSLSRTTTFEDQDQEHVGQDTRTDNGREGNSGDLANVRMAGTPLGKRLPRATIHGTPSYTNSAGTQTTTPPAQHTPTPLHTPVNPQLVSLSTPTTRSRSRLSFAAPGSPYYSPDSPSQISRSTIIPFDLDASRRAAQEQRSRGDGSSSSQQGSGNDSDGVVIRVQHGPQTPITKEKGRLASLIGMVTTPAKGTPVKRRGVVRKRSLWDRENAIVAGVRDGSSQRRWWTGRNEQPDWDDVFKTPEEMSKGNLGRFERLEGSSVVRRGVLSGFGSWVFFLLLVGLAAANAWYLFNSYRRYDLRYRTSPVDSPHAKTALKPEVGEEQEKPGTWKTKLWTATQ
ncbi:hypothetical protein QFC19_005370 [Naganishia cerealis]|uniref:Uncharacterized protein n=1 Tax=Naganishia cerealis TaxID=610337 RepID=A0ACC2VNI1_9TREE|nr:hypothetical protein QFC19_005370 [Naganishia cerealis]